MNTVRMLAIFLFAGLLVLSGSGCSALQQAGLGGAKDETTILEETVTAENAAQLAERARQELSYDEYRLVLAYAKRVHPHLPEGSLPVGISLRTMLESQRDFESAAARQAASGSAEAPAAPSAPAAPASPVPAASPAPRSQARSEAPPAVVPAPSAPAASQAAAQPPAPAPDPVVPPSAAQPAAPAAPPVPATKVVKSGTNLEVRLTQSVSSKRNQDGDAFRAELAEDLVVDGSVIAREGTVVVGRLSNVKASGKVEGRATMALSLTAIELGDEAYDIRSNRLDFEARGTGKDDAKKIGIATGIGAAIGAIAGGGKGAAIGGAIGAGAGTGAVLATSGDEVEFGVEQLFSFRLARDVELPIVR